MIDEPLIWIKRPVIEDSATCFFPQITGNLCNNFNSFCCCLSFRFSNMLLHQCFTEIAPLCCKSWVNWCDIFGLWKSLVMSTQTDLAQKQFNIKWIAVSSVVWHSGQIGFAWPPRLIMMPAVSCLFCWTVANGSFYFEVTKSKYRTLIYLCSVSIYEAL